jgi:hypothetical protein
VTKAPYAHFALSILLVGSGVLPTNAAAASATAPLPIQQIQAVLEQQRQRDHRVVTVALRLQTAAAGLCQSSGPLTGMELHDQLEYAPADRAAAASYYRLGDAPSVLTVAEDGPASRAGIVADDALLAVNGQSLAGPLDTPSAAGDRPASLDALTQAWSLLNAELSKGPAQLTIRRRDRELTLSLTTVAGCGYEAQVITTDALEADSDGQHLRVSNGFVDYAGTDDQLAVILGHEMAHNILRHYAQTPHRGLNSGWLFGRGDLARREREADYVGLYLLARAGYDIGAAEGFWRRREQDTAGTRFIPTWSERARNARATVMEIEAKRRAGQPLVPNPAPTRQP